MRRFQPAGTSTVRSAVRLKLLGGVLVCLSALFSPASAQVVVPTFGTRGEVPDALRERFMNTFRERLAALTGLPVVTGDLVPPGIAASLDADYAPYIAELGEGRYGVSGEIVGPDAGRGRGPQYSVSILVGDRETGEVSDLVSQPLVAGEVENAVAPLVEAVVGFLSPASMLPTGSASLFISSEPSEAEVLVNNVRVGRTGALEPLALEPGAYEVEFRKEGFLPYTERVVLEAGRTEFVDTLLSPISGGSIQITSRPPAQVYLEGVKMGDETPLAFRASPGLRELRLSRPGFYSQTISVPVRNFRVSRVPPVTLEPLSDLLIFWDPPQTYLVFIDGLYRPDGYVSNLVPGRHLVELQRSARARTRFIIDVPATGHFELDMEGERLVPFGPE